MWPFENFKMNTMQTFLHFQNIKFLKLKENPQILTLKLTKTF